MWTVVTTRIMNSSSKPSRKRGVVVAYTYSLNNIGDISNTSGLVNLLNEELPEEPLHVIASQVEGSDDYQQVEGYYERTARNCQTYPNPFRRYCGTPRFGDSSDPWGRFCDRWGSHRLDAFAKGCLEAGLSQEVAEDLLGPFIEDVAADMAERSPRALQAFAESGFLVFSSGTVLNFGRLQVRDFWNYALHFAMPLMLARHLGLPYGINAHSFDAIDWPVDRVLRPIFKEARFVYGRDGDSVEYLRQRDLHNAREGYRPDTSFFFSVRNAEWAEEFLRRNNLSERGFLVLITRHSALQFDKETEWDKVGGDPTAGSVSLERQEAQMAKLRAFLESWIAETGVPVLMALETRAAREPMRHWLDRDLSEQARNSMVWLEEFWASEEAFSVYERARIIMSMEMHSMIMGVKARTPVVHIPFRECGRKAHMLKDLGLGDWLVDIDETTDANLLAVCRSIHDDFETSVKRTHQAMEQAEPLGRGVIQEIGAILANEASIAQH